MGAITGVFVFLSFFPLGLSSWRVTLLPAYVHLSARLSVCKLYLFCPVWMMIMMVMKMMLLLVVVVVVVVVMMMMMIPDWLAAGLRFRKLDYNTDWLPFIKPETSLRLQIVFMNDKDPFILHIQYCTIVTDLTTKSLTTKRTNASAVTNTNILHSITAFNVCDDYTFQSFSKPLMYIAQWSQLLGNIQIR